MRIDVGGAENPTRLMSHDWHTNNGATPWHPVHVQNGLIANGPWALQVVQAGRYQITLWRWPEAQQRAMQCVRAAIEVAGVAAAADVLPSATHASFEVDLPAGPAMLRTKLVRATVAAVGGAAEPQEHGAYFASVRWLSK